MGLLMGKLIKNGILYGNNSNSIKLDTTLSIKDMAADAKAVGDAITSRYNEETDYIEVIRDGEWKQTLIKVGLAKQYLFIANNNFGEFVPFLGTYTDGHATLLPTLTLNPKIQIEFVASALYGGSIVSKLIDVTNYSKIVLKHESTTTGSSSWDSAKLFITSNKEVNMEEIATATIIQGNISTSSSGIVELDVSSVSGEIYIGIELSSNTKTVTINVEEMYLE